VGEGNTGEGREGRLYREYGEESLGSRKGRI